MKTSLITLCIVCVHSILYAQPYFDVALVKGTASPDGEIWKQKNRHMQYNQFIAGASIPIVFKKDSSKLIFSAFTERWDINAESVYIEPDALISLLGAVTFTKPISKKWSLAASVIPRWNGNSNDLFDNSFQMGGTLLGIYKKSPNLSYRFGVYYNDEFFGPFIVPLLGLDWKISDKDNLFGVLPQIFTYEHKVNNWFYWGAAYRMFNNSYRLGYLTNSSVPNYLRIIEMQLMLSSDIYLNKHIVFNVEAGHSLVRHLMAGTDTNRKDYYSDDNINGGWIFKAGLMYRMRLR